MKVNEIFQSISGEVGDIPQGAVTWFIRFQGCNLPGCSWCDTPKAMDPEADSFIFSPIEIAATIPKNSNVILTGGEPMLQDKRDLTFLVSLLEEKGCLVQIETNGSLPPYLPICHVFDYKTPSSGMHDKMMPIHQFLECPGFAQTWIKFVVKDLVDLGFTLEVLKDFYLQRPGYTGLRMALSLDSGEGVSYALGRLKETMPNILHKIVFNFQLHKHFNFK